MTCKPTLLSLALMAALAVTPAVNAAEEDYDTLIQQSLQQRNSGDFETAEATLRQAYPLARETNEVAYLLGLVLAFQERFIDSMAVIDEGLERYPDDVQLTLAKARVLTYQGQYAEATEYAEQVTAMQPDNLEAGNLLARIYVYQRRYGNAREAYEDVLAVDAENLEAQIGLYDTEIAAGNDEEADAWLARAAANYPDHIDVLTRQERNLPPVTRPHLLVAGVGSSDFDLAGVQQWYDRFAEYRYTNDQGSQYYLRAEHAHRFGAHDTLNEVGALFLRRNGLPIQIAYGWTADNDFMPEQRLRASIGFDLLSSSENFGATTLDIGAQYASYGTGDVTGFSLGFTHYLLFANAWLTPGLGWIEDEDGDDSVNWSLGAHWQITGRLRLGYTYADAPETNNSITVSTLTNHVYGQYQLSDGFSLRLDLSRHERERSYTRESLGLSLQYRF